MKKRLKNYDIKIYENGDGDGDGFAAGYGDKDGTGYGNRHIEEDSVGYKFLRLFGYETGWGCGNAHGKGSLDGNGLFLINISKYNGYEINEN